MTAFVDFSSLTALVVDDKRPIHRLMETILYKLGFRRVLNAYDGLEAEQVLLDEGYSIDIVFCDLWMPHKDGIALINAIRKSRYKNLPVVVITGHGDHDLLVEAISLGIEGFLAKPISPDQLIAHIGPALQKKRIDPVVFWMNEKIADYLEDDGTGSKIRPIVWSSEISIGHEILDAKHERLTQLINRLLEVLNDVAESQTVTSVYREMMREVVALFRHEEDLMRTSKYPDIKAHKSDLLPLSGPAPMREFGAVLCPAEQAGA